MSGPRRAWAWRALRLSVTGLLLVVIVRQAGGAKLLQGLAGLAPGWIVAATVANLVFMLVATCKWRALILPRPDELRIGTLARVYFASCFLGAVGPGTLGVDAVRVLCLGRYGARRTTAVISVLADRLLGVTANAVVAAPVLLPMAVGAVAGAALPRGLEAHVDRIRLALGALWREPTRLLAGFGFALASVAIWGIVGWCTMMALGAAVPLAMLVAFVASAEIASAVPISLQGVGVREVVFLTVLAPHGVSAADAALLGLLLYGQVLITALIGAAVVFTGGVPRPREMMLVG